ncbi:MAG: lysophospholipid acyltransferase family protein [Bacteroidetes bacterium]|nr:lysophospholipid acyltransferase family protein [Bacteroidota bacterium]
MTHKTGHFFEYIFFQAVSLFIRILPLSLVRKTASALARPAYKLLKSRRNVALQNLKYAFPDMEESERRQIALKSFQSVAVSFLELLWYPNFSKDRIKREVQIENLELFKQLHEKGKGVIILTAHYGSWELATQAYTVYADTPVCTIAKTQSNLLVDRKLTRLRELFGLKIVPMGIGVREVLKTLQQGGIVALAADQSAPKESVMVNFFGRKVPTFQGPAIFALRTGAPIILGCTVRQDDGTYRMRFIQVETEDLGAPTNENVYELTRRQVQMTEEIIRQKPEQWMWMHKRWKHSPEQAETEL